MGHTFVAYIDESGDDGLGNFRQPGARGGASNWLVLSALLFRKAHDLDAVSWRDQITKRMPEKKSRHLHFANLNHGQKLFAVRKIASYPVKAVSVVAHKPNIADGTYTEKNQLYFDLARRLIERLSWLSRDLRPEAPEGDGRLEITFSRRGHMSYGDFRAYMQWLKLNEHNEVHWPVIDVDGILARDHSTRAGLQLVDTVASAIAGGVEPDRYGNCESRYAEILKPIIYNRQGDYFSYGLSFYPAHTEISLSVEQQRLIKLFK